MPSDEIEKNIYIKKELKKINSNQNNEGQN